jgi:hypothetical protein
MYSQQKEEKFAIKPCGCGDEKCNKWRIISPWNSDGRFDKQDAERIMERYNSYDANQQTIRGLVKALGNIKTGLETGESVIKLLHKIDDALAREVMK